MKAYYNEFDPGAAQWLRNLIAARKIPDGTVDQRDIRLVQPADLKGFAQCHFFAGIAGWPLALALAGWDELRPVWTGSCPCQPFSVCGSRKGASDDRHLWPEFYRLISQCRPPAVFGEQVASKDGLGWLAGVRADLEVSGYAVGAADLPAAGVSAPHIRQRLWWVADSNRGGCRQDGRPGGLSEVLPGGANQRMPSPGSSSPRGTDRMAVSNERPGREERANGGGGSEGGREEGLVERFGRGGAWGRSVLIPCADGKVRRIEPGLSPLAHGIPNRVVRLRSYGNAIVPEVAAEFVRAYLGT